MGLRKLSGLVAAAATSLVLAPAAAAVQTEDGKVVESFDGTPIVTTTFLPDTASTENPVPAVLITHGWGGSRSRSHDGFIGQLLGSGYAVLTWDQRGFGESGGEVQVDDPDFEARDVSALIDELAADPRIAKEADGDPLIGMSGGSYAGGVQFIAAATDPRIDAIAPEIAWHNLLESLIPEGIVKTGWGSILYAGGQTALTNGLSPTNPAGPQTGAYNPQIHRALVEAAATGTFSKETREFFASKGPDFLLDRIDAPTFIIQGRIDTLFTPNQAIANFETLSRILPAAKLKMAWYCGGHGVCAPFSPGPEGYVEDRVVDWFDRWLKAGESVETGPRFEYLTDDGVWHGAGRYPVPGTRTAGGSGGGLTVVNGEPVTTGLLQGSEGRTSVEIPVELDQGTIVGQPTVRLTETGVGTATDAIQQAPLFFQLVNKTKEHVVGNQVTPKLVATDGESHSYRFPLEGVAYTVDPGDEIVLQVASTSAGFEPYRGAAAIDLERVEVELPMR